MHIIETQKNESTDKKKYTVGRQLIICASDIQKKQPEGKKIYKTNHKYIGYVVSAKTSLFHGAVFLFSEIGKVLSETTERGYQTKDEAMYIASMAHPNAELIDKQLFWDVRDRELEKIIETLPEGALVRYTGPRRRSDQDDISITNEGVKIEVFVFNNLLAPKMNINISASQLRALVAQKIIKFSHAIGDNTNSYFRVNHYVVL